MIRTALAVCMLAASVAAAAEVKPFDPARMSAHVKTLASDPFDGRAPATQGERRTVAYIVEQFKKAGLSPGGENGGWTQPVDLWKIETDRPKLRIDAGSDSFEMTNGGDIALGAHAPLTDVSLKDAPMVFVGYGVSAPERDWDDFKGVDLHGKVAVFLVNDPDYETPEANSFDGRAMTYYGRWTYKFEEAARRGAAGTLVVHEDGPAGYGWESLARSWLQPQFDIIRQGAPPRPLFESWIARGAAVKVFAMAGLDFEALKTSARGRDFRPLELGKARLSTRFGVKRTSTRSNNVIGVLKGRRFPDETVLYSAHWDHLGSAEGPGGKAIYRGAVDNASGVAGLIELARAFGRAPRPERSVQFIAFTAEEKGLLGSEYYVGRPTRPLATTALALNMDSLSSLGRAKDLVLVSRGRSDADALVDRVAALQGRTPTGDPTPETGTFFRSDHFWLSRMGVPSAFIGASRDLRQGGQAAGDAAYQDYVRNRYHQAADAWSPRLDLSGAAEDVAVLYEVGSAVANSRIWPAWGPANEFEAVRSATSAERRP